MGATQIWQQDGCGIDEVSIRRVIGEFRENGVQGIKSAQCLSEYMGRLDDIALAHMFELDKDVTLQILVDCVGITQTIAKYERIYGISILKGGQNTLRIFPKRKWQEAAFEMHKTIEELEATVRSKDFEIVTLKAKLYDTYEAINNPTAKTDKGVKQQWKPKTEKTPSESLE